MSTKPLPNTLENVAAVSLEDLQRTVDVLEKFVHLAQTAAPFIERFIAQPTHPTPPPVEQTLFPVLPASDVNGFDPEKVAALRVTEVQQ